MSPFFIIFIKNICISFFMLSVALVSFNAFFFFLFGCSVSQLWSVGYIPWLGIESVFPALGVQNCSTRTTRGFLDIHICICSLFFFFFITFVIIILQWYITICCIIKWIIYTYRYVHSPLSLPPIPSLLLLRSMQSTKLSSACYTATFH